MPAGPSTRACDTKYIGLCSIRSLYAALTYQRSALRLGVERDVFTQHGILKTELSFGFALRMVALVAEAAIGPILTKQPGQ